MIHEVRIGRKARKQLQRVPARIVDALETWVGLVEEEGLEQARKVPGYHDEPLRGNRKGQRSVRLNRAYRLIYEVVREDDGTSRIEFVSIEEVTKHEY